MKIALLTRRFPPLIGGAERMLSYLAAALAEQGADVTVLTSRLDVEHLPSVEQRGRVSIVRLPTWRMRFAGTLRYMHHLDTYLRTHRPDLAYVSMLKHDAYVAVAAGRKCGFPIVLRPEGAGATGDIAWHNSGRFGRRIRERCREADALVAISPAIRDELVSAGFETSHIHHIANGVPIPEVAWEPRNGRTLSPRALFVGRLAPEKRVETLIAAWPAVRAAFPNAALTIVGDGAERAALQAIAQPGIAFVGATDDATPFLKEADLLVLPSEQEGMSMALLEAMAFGLPVVASDIPGNRGLILHGEHGRLFRVGDAAALAQAVIDQWSRPEEAFAMSQQARKRVERDFSVAAVAREHLRLFEELLKARRSRT